MELDLTWRSLRPESGDGFNKTTDDGAEHEGTRQPQPEGPEGRGLLTRAFRTQRPTDATSDQDADIYHDGRPWWPLRRH